MGEESLETVDGRTLRTDAETRFNIDYTFYERSEMERIADFVVEASEKYYGVGTMLNVADEGADFDASMVTLGNDYIALTCEAHEPVVASVDEWSEVLSEYISVPFGEYVREHIEHGGYERDDDFAHCDLRLAEYVDDDANGRGFITNKTIRSAIEDENVEVVGVGNGWLELDDNRGDSE